MEGNACYRFSTIRRFVEQAKVPPIRTIFDVGANVGDASLLALSYFPNATVIAFEPVPEYRVRAKAALDGYLRASVVSAAVTSEHEYEDDLGERPRAERARLEIWKALPEAGPGWIGGSQIRVASDRAPDPGFVLAPEPVIPLSLAEVLERFGPSIFERTDSRDVDIMKMDCEGGEHSALGCADPDTLRRCRFIVGEYHGLARFVRVVEQRLFRTHKVNIVVDPIDKNLGAFFAERLEGDRDGVLRFDRSGMRIERPWLLPYPFEWNLFDERYVAREERRDHGFG